MIINNHKTRLHDYDIIIVFFLGASFTEYIIYQYYIIFNL